MGTALEERGQPTDDYTRRNDVHWSNPGALGALGSWLDSPQVRSKVMGEREHLEQKRANRGG